MKIIQFIKNKIEQKKVRRLQRMEKYLEAYFLRQHRQASRGILAIPYFLEAQRDIENLKQRGLIEETYKQIKRKKGVA